ncbi:chorismate mutase [delta proteobacterium NaphS2]|nr:chorismate mutase [delta proteobacterium NaphS2]
MIAPELHLIAAQLEGLEETIITKLIDRAQFKANLVAYKAGKSGFDGVENESLFDLRLRYHEEMDAYFGRFCVPEERPFTPGLPLPRRKVTLPPSCLAIDEYEKVNLSAEIKSAYLDLVPRFCAKGDDGQYGSSVEHDVIALQAIGRRIHFGAMYVAESKYRSDPVRYRQLIRGNDTDTLMQLLTRKDVEKRILQRVKEKLHHIQIEVNREIRIVIDPEDVFRFYRDYVIPLTKKGEVLYLLNRRTRVECGAGLP